MDFVMNFTPGIVVTTEMIYESNIFKLIARKMAKMHKIELTEEQKKNEPMIISKTLEYLETIPERFSDDKKDFKVRQLLPSKQSLLTEFLFLQSVLKSLHSPIVFCHNDLNMVNIIYTADIEK
ncbi:hypothetical protein PVAND_015087 [Polypedilum vanderplanki]|uniref:ethanolamine kinase n=1 Tax=Polypedilum vanderplanki TaxID=319348 RepID=A0A9J6BC00_POLVA|nr:hypothetical protein PVAND_015087 [Polypedilum vanderplanki]